MASLLRAVTDDLLAEAGDYGREATLRRVRWYQAVLRYAAGHDAVPVSGNHNDLATRAALRDLQARVGVRPTGYLRTVRMNNALIQLGLEEIYLGKLPTPLGSRDSALVDRIRAFQAYYGLVPDGDVGKATMPVMTEVLIGVRPRPVQLRDRHLGPVRPLGADAAGMPEASAPTVRYEPREAWNPHMIVGDTDDRRCVFDTTKPPYRYVCRVEAIKRIRVRNSVRSRSFLMSAAGTGLLIGPRHVLTAAHVLRGEVVKEPAKSPQQEADDAAPEPPEIRISEAIEARVSPAFNGFYRKRRKRRPFGTVASTLWFLPGCWSGGGWTRIGCRGPRCDIETGRHVGSRYWRATTDGRTDILSDNADFALLVLQRPVNSGYWGETNDFRITETDSFGLYFDPPTVHTTGYPARRPAVGRAQCNTRRNGMPWISAGTVDMAHIDRDYRRALFERDIDFLDEPNLFIHDMDFGMGQSGGPVWSTGTGDNGKAVRTLVGIALGGFRKYVDYDKQNSPFNYGLALTANVLCQIATWAGDTFEFKNGVLRVR